MPVTRLRLRRTSHLSVFKTVKSSHTIYFFLSNAFVMINVLVVFCYVGNFVINYVMKSYCFVVDMKIVRLTTEFSPNTTKKTFDYKTNVKAQSICKDLFSGITAFG